MISINYILWLSGVFRGYKIGAWQKWNFSTFTKIVTYERFKFLHKPKLKPAKKFLH